MRKFVLAFLLALVAAGTAGIAVAGQDAFDFGDMPPLPPPLLDDAPNPPPLSPPEGGAASPLVQQSNQPAPVAPLAPPPASPLAPPPAQTTAGSAVTPLAPPSAPPLTPLAPPPPQDGVATFDLPGEVGAPATAAVAATPAVPETPLPAKVLGGRVNVRAGPNTQYESIAVITTGTPITVLAKNGDWYKIIYPADQLASIHKNYVDAEITGEIPEAGLPGIVNQDGAEVRAFYWDKSTIVGKLNKGDPVTIKQERGQWYRIAAPATARAFVFAEYVRVDGNAQVAMDTAPPPENPAVDLTQGKPGADGNIRMSKTDEQVTKLKEARFKQLREDYAREEERAQESVSRLEVALNDLEAQLRAIDDETNSRISYPFENTTLGAVAWAPPDPVYGGYTGWVENIGRVGGAPASFRLSKGGEVRFYLRSDRFGLNDFVGRRVWLNGSVEVASGAAANVLNVDQIRILTDMEIAESMRQYEEASSGQTQPFGSPYAQPVASDPYATYYDQGAVSQPPIVNYGQPTPVVPSDASDLPDIVGMGQGGYVGGPIEIVGSSGEVGSDYYENPIISEIGP